MNRLAHGLGLVAATVGLIACSTRGPYEIQGVGVGSDCDFTGEFADLLSCENLEGIQPSPFALTEVHWSSVPGAVIIGFASSKSISSLDGDEVESSQIDGTLGIVKLSPSGSGDTFAPAFVVTAIDGSTSTCRISMGPRPSFRCDNW